MAVAADLRGAQLDDLEVDRAGLTVTVTRTARVVLLDRLPLVADWAMASATKRASCPSGASRAWSGADLHSAARCTTLIVTSG